MRLNKACVEMATRRYLAAEYPFRSASSRKVSSRKLARRADASGERGRLRIINNYVDDNRERVANWLRVAGDRSIDRSMR